jgi:predicted GH43/DUF377 family glycosyl hydrolase
MENVFVIDIAKRFKQNPLLRPKDLKPSREGMVIECLLNPGVFRFQDKTWLLIRVAERPVQRAGHISIPIYNEEGEIEILNFKKTDPDLDRSDPRVIRYREKEYLTTLSHLRLVCSRDGKIFHAPENYPPIFGKDKLEALSRIAVSLK